MSRPVFSPIEFKVNTDMTTLVKSKVPEGEDRGFPGPGWPFSGLQFPYLENGDHSRTYLILWLSG